MRQKLELGLIDRDQKQVKKLKELEIDTDPRTSEIILYLVDYNPYSEYKDKMLSEAKKLGFSSQIRIADGGLAMWDKKRERWEGI